MRLTTTASTATQTTPVASTHTDDDFAMSIAVIAQPRFPISEPFAGGLEAHVWYLCQALRRRGHHVDLYAGTGSDDACQDVVLPVVTWKPGEVPSDTELPPGGRQLIEAAFERLSKHLIAVGEKYDVIHNHCLYPEPLISAQRWPAPMLTTFHTPPFPELEAAVLQGTASQFAAVSEYTAREWRLLAGECAVISNAVDTRVWKRGHGGGDVAWIGRIVPEKAPHLAIAAARQAGHRIVIAGRIGDEAYFANEVEPLLGSDATYVGHLSQQAAAALVGGSRALLCTPVWDEPFGLVCAEAMCTGTPAVAFGRGGLSEVIAHGTTGIVVDPLSADPIAEMAAGLTRAAKFDRSVVERAAVQRFSLDAMCSRYEAAYRAVMPGPLRIVS